MSVYIRLERRWTVRRMGRPVLRTEGSIFGEVIQNELEKQERRGFGCVGGFVFVDEFGSRDSADAGQYG